MKNLRRYPLLSRLIRLLIAVALVLSYGCGSRQVTQDRPPVDRDLERTNRAARMAFDNGRIQQAAELYRQALERATMRDDLAAIVDAKYNLAACLTLMQAYPEALDLVYQTRGELSRAGRSISGDILLLEATILYRDGRPDDAWLVTEEILAVPARTSALVKSRTHFIRGLIADGRGDTARLREEIALIGNPEAPALQADRDELQGHLATAERNWDAAIKAFDEAARLRREIFDYRGMVIALAKAGEACIQAGQIAAASDRFLRAGQSAALQGDSDHAQNWLTRSAELAEQGGDKLIAQKARYHLDKLQKSQSASPPVYEPSAAGLR